MFLWVLVWVRYADWSKTQMLNLDDGMDFP